MVFDDTVTPGTNGGSLTYAYTRLTSAAPAGFRAFNTEYTPGQAKRLPASVDLKPMGGAFTLDRVFKNLGPAATNEITFQLGQIQTSVPIRFAQELILGDTAVDANGFDGLSKVLTGSTTEKTAVVADWTAATVITQPLAMARLDEVDEWLSSIVPSHTGGGDAGMPGALPPGQKAILGNTKSITRFKALARWAGMYTKTEDSLGRKIMSYGDWTLVDIGDRLDGSAPIIPVSSSSTDLYAITFGLDSVHCASAAGNPLVQTWLPDFSTAGAVKTGEIEMGPAALVVKNTKAAGVLRGIDVV
jgi:hypothetical protein